MAKVSIPVEVRPIKNRSNRITGFHAWIADVYGSESILVDVNVTDKEQAVPYLCACLYRLLESEMPLAFWASDGRTVFLVRSVGGGQVFGYEIIHAGKTSGCLVSGFPTKDEASKAAQKHASDYCEIQGGEEYTNAHPLSTKAPDAANAGTIVADGMGPVR